MKPRESEQYYFTAKQKYANQHHGKVVSIVAAGDICSVCMTDEGRQFAAMNDELTYINPDEESKQPAY